MIAVHCFRSKQGHNPYLTMHCTGRSSMHLIVILLKRLAGSYPEIIQPLLSAWMEENLAEGFTLFDFPLEYRRSIRTTNSLERIYKEIKRRIRVVGVFPYEASCLRLVTALLMETSEEWQIGKRYEFSKSCEC